MLFQPANSFAGSPRLARTRQFGNRHQPTVSNCGRRTNLAEPVRCNTAGYGVLPACATGSGVWASLQLAESPKRVATTTTVVATPAINKRVRNEKVLVPIGLPSF